MQKGGQDYKIVSKKTKQGFRIPPLSGNPLKNFFLFDEKRFLTWVKPCDRRVKPIEESKRGGGSCFLQVRCEPVFFLNLSALSADGGFG
ncbi:MAG: hypothetical protein BZ151_07490 [Desulfobacca sp. 4484_104]|nr:MAG: hypothetical protein BZ151_07490 [Desulfobacca sp. 4484_104]RLB72163.1 MAG: hypothetical protein DRH04_00055 [Deltaproteobacteria bacterium]